MSPGFVPTGIWLFKYGVRENPEPAGTVVYGLYSWWSTRLVDVRSLQIPAVKPFRQMEPKSPPYMAAVGTRIRVAMGLEYRNPWYAKEKNVFCFKLGRATGPPRVPPN